MRALVLATLLLGCTTGSRVAPGAQLDVARGAMCRDESTCHEQWGADLAGCNVHLDRCLQTLTLDQQREWSSAVERCVATTSSCTARFTCYAGVPRC